MTPTCPAPDLAEVGATNLADILSDAKSLVELLHLREFRNANGWRWSLGPEGAKHVADVVAAHLASPEVVERMARASCNAAGCNGKCHFPTCGCEGPDVEMRAAVAAAVKGTK